MKERPILFSGEMVRAILEERKTQTRRIVKNPEHFGCFTGDCPHETQLECNQAITEFAAAKCQHGRIGDRLWVKETFYDAGKTYQSHPEDDEWKGWSSLRKYFYAAHGLPPTVGENAWGHPVGNNTGENKFFPHSGNYFWKKKPSIFMPRNASRITLEITKVRVERLQDISEADALAEGIKTFTKDGVLKKYWPCDPCEGDLKCEWINLPYSPVAAYRALWESINGEDSWNKNPWVWVIGYKRIK